MHPAIKDQVTAIRDADIITIDTGLDCSHDEDQTRQEYKDDADVNVLLAKFGVQPVQRPPIFGEVDYDINLQHAMTAVLDARAAHARLPEDLRKAFPTWMELLAAIDNGQITIKDTAPITTEPTNAPTPN